MNLISELRQRQVTAPYFISKDGAGRELARLPIWLYRLHLGWLLGQEDAAL